jgi:hypothetical protein
MPVKLKELENIDSYVVWDAGLITDSNWPVYLFVKLEYTEQYDREWAEHGKYHVSVEAAAPQAPDAETVGHAHAGWLSDDEYKALPDQEKARVLAEYGVKAVLWQKQGSNLRKLLKEARHEVGLINMLFGFYMDKQMNAIGNDGWDFIRGDIGFKRKAE